MPCGVLRREPVVILNPETVPVQGAQRLTLLFPQWIIGDPVPPNALDQLAGLVVSAAGNTLKWQRDAAEPAAFHVDVPAGVKAVDLSFQFLVPSDQRVGPVLAPPRCSTCSGKATCYTRRAITRAVS